MNVAIVGGGYTGLVAALRLAQKGHKVTILERNKSVGGLASDFTVEGVSLEKAYHHLFKTDTDIINLTKELGIGDKLEWHDSAVATYYDGKLYPFMTPMDLLKFSPLSLPNRIRAGLAVFYLQRTNNWKQFEHITAYQWMLKNAGKQVTEVIWEPLLKGKFDKYYDKVSMAWLWARIHIRANSREAGDKSEKLGYFNGGFQTFTNALVAALKKNEVVIKTGANISNIDSLDSGEVKINFDDGKSQTFDSCLATTPSHVFAKLIGHNKNIKKEYIDQLNGTNYLGALLYIFSSDQEISPYYWHNINDTDLSFLVFINHTRLIDKKNYKNHYVYYIGAYLDMDHRLFKASEEDIEKEWHTGLKQIFPDFDASKIREKHIFKLGNAQHIVDTDYASHIPSYKSPLSNIYLANFAQIYPEDRGTNYAVREGEKVADIMMSAR